MKKILCSFTAVLMVLLLVGCGEAVATINSHESTTDHSASMQYDSFDGTMEYKLSVSEADLPTTVSVEITTESGALALSIEKADGTDTP